MTITKRPAGRMGLVGWAGRTGRVGRAFRGLRSRLRDERGAATAEYAITILAAVGFAGVLVALLKGDQVKAILSDLVHRALSGG
jgi:Flp pilus assembly pilin Flp